MKDTNPTAPAVQNTALLSVYNKNQAFADFAENLVGLGWSLLGSSGTKKFLDERGTPCKDVADIVGPPILGHRVVTLSREVHAALLSRLGSAEDEAELARIGVQPIELVYVDLYPLAEAMKKPGRTQESVIEMIDIGGPTMLRSAAKADRIVVTNQDQFELVLDGLRQPGGVTWRVRMLMAARAELVVHNYTKLAYSFYESTANSPV